MGREKRILAHEKMKKDIAQAQQAVEYVHMLLWKCKEWGAQMVTINELESCIRHQNPLKLKAILRIDYHIADAHHIKIIWHVLTYTKSVKFLKLK